MPSSYLIISKLVQIICGIDIYFDENVQEVSFQYAIKIQWNVA